MTLEEKARQISQLSEVRAVGYHDYMLWILVEHESDLLECEKVPRVKEIEYNIVTSEREIPESIEIIR